MVNTLTAEEIHKLLDTARVSRLGCIANGEPYVMPINYDFRDGAICERAEQRYPLPQRPAQMICSSRETVTRYWLISAGDR
jgi:hypothetical protein